jgi:hypothetical protein
MTKHGRGVMTKLQEHVRFIKGQSYMSLWGEYFIPKP